MSIYVQIGELDGRKLPDGDKIEFTRTVGGVSDDSQIKLSIELGPGVSRWKGIGYYSMYLQADDSTYIGVEKDHTPMEITLDYSKFLEHFLCLGKGRIFGKNAYVYLVSDFHTAMKAGNTYKFKWIKD
jgi:hypothetical protein